MDWDYLHLTALMKESYFSLSQFSLVTGFLREREKIFYTYSGPQRSRFAKPNVDSTLFDNWVRGEKLRITRLDMHTHFCINDKSHISTVISVKSKLGMYIQVSSRYIPKFFYSKLHYKYISTNNETLANH